MKEVEWDRDEVLRVAERLESPQWGMPEEAALLRAADAEIARLSVGNFVVRVEKMKEATAKTCRQLRDEIVDEYEWETEPDMTPAEWQNTETRAQICDEVKNIICKDRQDQYGGAEDSFAAIAEGWNWWLRKKGMLREGQYLTPVDVADLMQVLKIARSIANPYHADSRKDAAGYAIIGASMVTAKKSEPNDEKSLDRIRPAR